MISPVYIANLTLLSRNGMIYFIVVAMNALSLYIFDNSFMYWKISLVGEKVSPERLIYCWSMIILLWKYSICSSFFNARMDRSYWTSPFSPPMWEVWIKNSILRFDENGCWQHCRPKVPWNNYKGEIVNNTNSVCPREVYVCAFQS